jgi:hypothetical protein
LRPDSRLVKERKLARLDMMMQNISKYKKRKKFDDESMAPGRRERICVRFFSNHKYSQETSFQAAQVVFVFGMSVFTERETQLYLSTFSILAL